MAPRHSCRVSTNVRADTVLVKEAFPVTPQRVAFLLFHRLYVLLIVHLHHLRTWSTTNHDKRV